MIFTRGNPARQVGEKSFEWPVEKLRPLDLATAICPFADVLYHLSELFGLPSREANEEELESGKQEKNGRWAEVVRKRFLIYALFQNQVSGFERRFRLQSE